VPPQPEKEFLLPLFPLPNLVFFPKTRLPLHVFEPRYRQMVSDAIAGEERIGMILLKPGWEPDYYGAPAVYDFGTAGVIERVVRFDDGRYNLILNGMTRFRVLEHVSDNPYRVARVEALPEVQPSPDEAYATREWLVELSNRYLEFLPGNNQVPELATATLDEITNALIMSLTIDVEEKQKLLETSAMLDRAERIGSLLQQRLETAELLAPYRTGGDPASN
jgi:Lon protease-like protein